MRPLIFIALLGLLLTGCQTTPQHVPSIAGTTWRGGDSDGDFLICTFEPYGRLHYRTPTGNYRNGTWRQRDANIYLETNQRYSEYFGTIRGAQMSGTARNIAHHKWNWVLRKAKR